MVSEVKISVVIPCYNCSKYIAETLNSVLSQTVHPHEIIAVDDGSTDSTAEIITSFGERVKLISQENKGRVGARKTGILAATGNWVALLDADDIWTADKIETQMKCISSLSDDIVIVHSNFDVVGTHCCGDDRKYTFDIPNLFGLDFLFLHNAYATSSIVIRRDVLLTVLPFWNLGRYRAQDYGLFLLVSVYGDSFKIDKTLSYYRVHESNEHNYLDFEIGVLKSRENLLDFIIKMGMGEMIKPEWKTIIGSNYFNIGWQYYSKKIYIEAREYFLNAAKNRLKLRYILYFLFSSLPESLITKIRLLFRSDSI